MSLALLGLMRGDAGGVAEAAFLYAWTVVKRKIKSEERNERDETRNEKVERKKIF